jgi:hypothetical protein
MSQLQEEVMFNRIAAAVLIVLIIIPVIITGAACQQDTAPTSKIEILDHSMTVQKFGQDPDSVAVITGTAKNTSGSIIQKAMIEATYYDKNGGVIGTSTSSIDNLGPDILWNFSTQFSSPDAWKIIDHKLTVK